MRERGKGGHLLEAEGDESDADDQQVEEVEQTATEGAFVQDEAIRYDLNERKPIIT